MTTSTFRIVSIGLLTAAAGLGGLRGASYINEAAWRIAVGNVYALETFDSLVAGSDVSTLPLLGIQFDPLNDNTQPTVQQYSQTGGIVKSGPHNLLNDRDFSLPARGPYVMRPLNPSELLFGVGLWNVGGDDTLRMTFYDAQNAVLESVISPSATGFFGIVNALGADKIVIDFVGGNGYAPVDDLQTAVRRSFNPVPEAGSTLAFFSLALVAMAGLRRRLAGR